MTRAALPSIGDVWVYPYLWSREAAKGETEGRKSRPVAVALLIRSPEGEQEILFVPITSQPSDGHPFALEVPEIEKQRAGLDLHVRLWVIADEANADSPAHSFYFEPDNRIGAFSLPFIKKIQAMMISALKSRKLRQTPRR